MKLQNRNVYFVSLIIPCATIAGNFIGEPFTALGIFLALGVYPLLDILFGNSESMNLENQNSLFFDFILYLHVFFQALSITSFIYHTTLTQSISASAVLSTGVNSGISGIVIAHELIHRKSFFQRMFGMFSLWTVNYLHFYVEHVRSHHRFVGTDQDPASAKKEEGLYLFIVKTIPLQWVSSFRIMKEKNGVWNIVLFFFLIQLVTNFLIGYFLGMYVLIAFVLQSFLAISLLEYVNYIRHWGLRRKIDERVSVTHSWQTNACWSRWTLIELTRHADHHYLASKEYWKLKPYEESPNLPGGYYYCFYLALIPPVWKKITGKRLPQN